MRHNRVPPNYKGRKSRRGISAVLLIALVIFCGFFVVWNLEAIMNVFRGSGYTPPQSAVEPPSTAEPAPRPTPEPEPAVALSGRMVGVYLPAEKAKSSQSILSFAAQVKEMGVNALVIDVKDTVGQILFSTPLGYSFMPAVTMEGAFDLSETVKLLKEDGFYLTARMSCFYDNLAPRRNPAMAIKTAGVVWLDWDYKSWLNPYSQLTREYLGDLAEYFSGMGFDEILLYNVEFPVRGKLELISYGTEDSPSRKRGVLADFLSYVKERVSDGCDVALQVSTAVLTEGPREASGMDLKSLAARIDVFVPQMYPAALPANSTVGTQQIENPSDEAALTVSSLGQLCRGLLQGGQTEIRPMLQGFASLSSGKMTGVCPDAVMQDQIEALLQNQFTQYDVYQPEGLYGEITPP